MDTKGFKHISGAAIDGPLSQVAQRLQLVLAVYVVYAFVFPPKHYDPVRRRVWPTSH